MSNNVKVPPIFTAKAYRDMSRKRLVMCLTRMYKLKQHDLCDVDNMTRDEVRREINTIAAEFKRRHINVIVEQEYTAKVTIDRHLNPGATSLERITV